MTDINALDLVIELDKRGLDAIWEQTGGGVGTIYVGPWAFQQGENDYPFSAALVGPGSYYDNTLTTYELAVGQDASYDPTYDDGGTFSWHEGESLTIQELADVVEVVAQAAVQRWTSDLFVQRLPGRPDAY